MNCSENLENCNAECCRVLVFQNRLLTKDQIDYYLKHGCKLTRLPDRTYQIIVPSVCKQLENNLCKLHNTKDKPKVCVDFDKSNKQGYYTPKNCIL